LAGGGYTIYVGGLQSNTNVRVVDNHLSTRIYPKVGQYGIWYYGLVNGKEEAPGVIRTGNVLHETGALVDGFNF
jgi:hypothetical protein